MATIAENLQTIIDIKNNIKTAIIGKGVSVSDTDSFTTYADKIESIETGGGTGGATSALDFSLIGYNTDLSAEINAKYNDDIAYSKTILDNWNPSTTSASHKYSADKKLVYFPNVDTSNVIDMYYMFYNCSSLTIIPLLYTSNVGDMSGMLCNCSSLTSIPLLDTSNVTNMFSMFYGCKSLTTIPLINTSNVINMNNMFANCSLLTTIPQLDTSSTTNVGYMFNNCRKLETLPLMDFGQVTEIFGFFVNGTDNNLTNLGGFKNLKISWTDAYGLYRAENLTYESVMNVINNLYDFRGNGDTTTTRTIKFSAKSKALLSDEDIAIATNKGWTIS